MRLAARPVVDSLVPFTEPSFWVGNNVNGSAIRSRNGDGLVRRAVAITPAGCGNISRHIVIGMLIPAT
jgi:hypothetical protein